MGRIKVLGGRPLRGTLQPSGNKNAALPVLAAALLCSDRSVLSNLPATTDVQHMVQAAANLGAEIHLQGSELELVPPGVPGVQIGPPLPTSPQASLLLAAASLHAAGRAALAPLNPYKERLATHCHVLSSFGVAIEVEDGVTKLHTGMPLVGEEIWLPEASVTATELAILLAARAEGASVLHNAACEPHVQDLARFLLACGARIEGSGSNRLVIQGVPALAGAHHRLAADPIEIGSFIAMAAMTHGEMDILEAEPYLVQPVLQGFTKLGIQVSMEGSSLHVPVHNQLHIQHPFEPEGTSLASAPWPGFPSDLIPLAAVVASQAQGSLLIHEKMYNTRMYFLDSLLSMGARVVQCDPHRALVFGANRLYPTYLETPDVRTGLALLGASLVASGTCTIDDVQVINRIFPDVLAKLSSLGAQIEILSSGQG